MFGYFPWYVRDYLSGTARGTLTLAEKGLYLDLLSIAWERGPARDESPPLLPDDPARLARLAHLKPAEFEAVWEGVGPYFESSDDGIFNPRQMQEYEKVKRLIEAKRVAGRKGGRAKAKASSARKKASTATEKASTATEKASSATAVLKQKLADPSYPDPYPDPTTEPTSSIPSGSSSPRPATDIHEEKSVCTARGRANSHTESAQVVFDHWQTFDALTRHRTFNGACRRHVLARLKEGYDEASLCQAVTRYAELCQQGKAPGYNRWGLGELMGRGGGQWLDRLLSPNFNGIGEPDAAQQAKDQIARMYGD